MISPRWKFVATVRTVDTSTGRPTTVLFRNVSCLLNKLPNIGSRVGGERAEMEMMRTFIWDPMFDIPEDAQVEADGHKWNFLENTFNRAIDRNGNDIFRSALVVRID